MATRNSPLGSPQEEISRLERFSPGDLSHTAFAMLIRRVADSLSEKGVLVPRARADLRETQAIFERTLQAFISHELGAQFEQQETSLYRSIDTVLETVTRHANRPAAASANGQSDGALIHKSAAALVAATSQKVSAHLKTWERGQGVDPVVMQNITETWDAPQYRTDLSSLDIDTIFDECTQSAATSSMLADLIRQSKPLADQKTLRKNRQRLWLIVKVSECITECCRKKGNQD